MRAGASAGAYAGSALKKSRKKWSCDTPAAWAPAGEAPAVQRLRTEMAQSACLPDWHTKKSNCNTYVFNGYTNHKPRRGLLVFGRKPANIQRVKRFFAFARIIFVAAALGLAGCPTEPVVPDPKIPQVKGSEWCERAEKNLLALGCEEGQPTKEGKSFTEFCKETQANGIDLNPQCLANISSCDQVDQVCAWKK